MPNDLIINGQYQHYKGGQYVVMGVAKHSENGEELVIYRDVNDEKKIWARPLAMFLEEVEIGGKKTPRFKYEGEIGQKIK